MSVFDHDSPFDALLATTNETIETHQGWIRTMERHRRLDCQLAILLFVAGVIFSITGSWLAWVYHALGFGMIGMAFHAQRHILRIEGWLAQAQADQVLFQLGAMEWENGEFADWILREAEDSGRYRFFSEG